MPSTLTNTLSLLFSTPSGIAGKVSEKPVFDLSTTLAPRRHTRTPTPTAPISSSKFFTTCSIFGWAGGADLAEKCARLVDPPTAGS